MGQLISLIHNPHHWSAALVDPTAAVAPQNDSEQHARHHNHHQQQQQLMLTRFPDLATLPRELAFVILSNLNATDLCLAACVWKELANDELLWRGLCHSQWPACSAYQRWTEPGFSFRQLYLMLDEARLTFNADSHLGVHYLVQHRILDDDAWEIAQFLHSSRDLDPVQVRQYLTHRSDVLDHFMKLKNFQNQFLPNALRKFFQEVAAPNERNEYLSLLLDKFSCKFIECNPQLGITADIVYILCFSLIMLSVDLCSPHVKNKMSKREFIRNTRGAARVHISDEFLGHLYDNVYLIGHVAGDCTLMRPTSPARQRRRR